MRFSLIASAAVTLVSAGSVFAAPTPINFGETEKAAFAGSYRANLGTGEVSLSPGATIVYNADNIGSGYSWAKATAGNRTVGDYVTPITGGILSDFTCSLFNPTTGGNAGTITSGSVAVTFSTFDTAGLPVAVIGGFTGNFDFTTAPLSAGFFTTLVYTGLETFTTPIVLPAGDYLVTTQFTTVGASLRQGVIVGGAATVGFSDFAVGTGSFYQVGTGVAAGAYSFAAPLNNLYLQVGTVAIPEPTAMGFLPLAGLVALRRRR